jgi:uncharacterized membrane protein
MIEHKLSYTPRSMKLIKTILIALIVIGYFWLMYTSAFASDSGSRTLVLTVLAWQLFAQWILWHQGKKGLAIAASLVCVPFFYFYSHLSAIQWVNLIPNTLIYGSLAWMFGRTLSKGQIPLITQLATKIQGELPPEIHRYTRQVTVAWTLFFAVSALLGIGLYYFVSFAAWSLFSNVYSTPLLIAMFVLEYAYRLLRYRQFKHPSLSDGMKAFMSHSAAVAEKPTSSKENAPK